MSVRATGCICILAVIIIMLFAMFLIVDIYFEPFSEKQDPFPFTQKLDQYGTIALILISVFIVIMCLICLVYLIQYLVHQESIELNRNQYKTRIERSPSSASTMLRSNAPIFSGTYDRLQIENPRIMHARTEVISGMWG